MKQLSEYDTRQLNRILTVISEFKSGKKSLYGLIGDVEFLIDALEDVGNDFRWVLLDEWTRLEIVYATALDLKREFNEMDLDEINDAVNKLIEAIIEAGGGKTAGEDDL